MVCLTEHGLRRDEVEVVSLYHYNVVSYFCRDNLKGGGTAIYAAENCMVRGVALDILPVQRDCEFCSASFDIADGSPLVICLYSSIILKPSYVICLIYYQVWSKSITIYL